MVILLVTLFAISFFCNAQLQRYFQQKIYQEKAEKPKSR